MDKDTWINIMDFGAYSSELDWIAVDNSGQIGVFNAIMDAPIPIEVKKSYELYSELKTIISKLPEHSSAEQVTTNSGDYSDWLAYSKKGLFAFDFQDAHRTKKEALNQYDLISRPSNPLSIDDLKLSKDIKTIIPRIEYNFRDGDIENKKITTSFNKKITEKEFYNIIKDTPVTPSKWGLFADVTPNFLSKEVFDLLVSQLTDPDNKTRFFALYHLIDKFRDCLAESNEDLANLMIHLLRDKYHPVIDRAAWALNIMRETGLEKLFENVNSRDPELRRLVLVTIGKSAHLNAKKSIEIFVEGLKDKNEDIRYIAMDSLMNLSPLGLNDSKTIEDFDFTPIYKMIKPVAKSFIESNNEEYRNFAGISFMRIKEEEEKW